MHNFKLIKNVQLKYFAGSCAPNVQTCVSRPVCVSNCVCIFIYVDVDVSVYVCVGGCGCECECECTCMSLTWPGCRVNNTVMRISQLAQVS